MTGSYHRAMPRDASEPRRGRGRRARHGSGPADVGADVGGDGRRDAAPATRRTTRARPRLQRVDETSAGGLVVDLDGEIPQGAIIGRTDRRGRLLWSLPKGHVEPGETAEQAAVREVAEETGIAGEILGSLGTIDFWFIADGRRVHKTVHHFLLRAVGGQLSDADIEVTEVAWVPLPRIADRLAYPDERGLIDAAGRLLADSA
jgi:8-oxo-dGTP pyrophosphatase MutT (NUDIX family)